MTSVLMSHRDSVGALFKTPAGITRRGTANDLSETFDSLKRERRKSKQILGSSESFRLPGLRESIRENDRVLATKYRQDSYRLGARDHEELGVRRRRSRLSLPGQSATSLFLSRTRSRENKRRQSETPERISEAGSSRTSRSFKRISSQIRIAQFLRNSKRRKDLLIKFRTYGKLAIFCARQSRDHNLRNKTYDELLPFINNLTFYDNSIAVEVVYSFDGKKLMFDRSIYKADRRKRLSEEARKVLSKPPSQRTAKEIYHAQIVLRDIEDITGYPVRMQQKIAEVGMYERYEAKRIILRQNHPASAFYFILSGSVVVMVMDEETRIAKPVAIMERGKKFGDISLIKNLNRQSSIIAKETVELLSISSKDFQKIFMNGGVMNINGPDYDDFLGSIECLQGWPTQLLANSKKCIFHVYKRGEVVVRDSNRNKWIYIVKSGSLQVLKKLRKVEAYEWKQPNAISPRPDFSYDPMKGIQFKFCRDGFAQLKPKEKTEEEIETEKLQMYQIRKHVLPEINVPLHDIDWPESGRGSKRRTPIDPKYNESKQVHINETNNHDREQNTVLPDITKVDNLVRRHTDMLENGSKSKRATTSAKEKRRSKSQMDSVNNNDLLGGEEASKQKAHRKSKTEGDRDVDADKDKIKQQIRTINDDLDNEAQRTDVSEEDKKPEFVHIQTLTKGHVFGVTHFVLGQQPSFCVVSNGAEVIMINRQYYIDNAPESLISQLRRKLSPYPTDEEMQESLQISVDWEAYKGESLGIALKEIDIKKKAENLYSPRD